MSDWRPVDHEVRAAVEFDGDRNFMIEAGAGTGKTELMVYRVVAMLRAGAATVDQLVVITFTDDAAAEISARTRQALELLASGTDAEVKAARFAPLTGDERARVQAALDGIHRAHIQTIHSFAASLLRERPVEAALDPAFQLLDEMQASADFDRAWVEWLDATLEQPHEALAIALDWGFGPRQLRTAAEVLHEHRAVLPMMLPKPDMPGITEFVELLLPAADELRRLAAYAGDDLRGLEDIAGIVEFAAQVDLLWAEDDAHAVTRVILTQWPDVKPDAGRRADWTDEAAAKDARDLRAAVRDALKPLHEALGTAVLLGVLPRIEQFVLGYAAERRSAGLATFDDLLLWARDLLENDTAREYFRAHFTRIIVDEFQDTDPVQADIVCCLASADPPPVAAPWTTMPPRDGVLTVVGDPKQSIYRFRRADLAVFDGIRGGVMEPHQVKIIQNFRSREGVLGWVNDVFSARFRPVPGVQPGNVPLVHDPRPPQVAHPAVHVGWAGPHEKIGPARPAEARLLAQMLIHARDAEWPVRDKRTKEVRPVTWGDMVVLTPAWTEFDVYRDALRDMGVPFRVGGGKGFFARPEVGHIAHLLEAIDDPLDDVAVAAVLRSPIYGCSDDELLIAKGAGGGINYRQYPRKECPPRVADAIRAMREMHDVLPRLTLTEAVTMAVDRSLLVEQALARQGDEQAAANLMKLIDMARRFNDVGATAGVRDFARWMREQREIEEDAFRSSLREGDAGIADAGDDVVRVMTVHASKGLEFPLVALVNMSGQKNITRSPIPDREGRQVHFHVKGAGGTHFAMPEYDNRWDPEKDAQAAEITRLMYVATTRARDHIVLPLAMAKEKMGRYMQEVRDFLPGPEDDPALYADGLEMIDAGVLDAVEGLPVADLAEPTDDEVARAAAARAQWIADRAALLERASEELVVTAASVHEQPTDGVGASDTDTDDVLRPTEARPADEPVDEWADPSDTDATRKGKALHLLMELIDYADPGDLGDAVAHACVAEGATGHEAEVGEWVANCLASEAAARALAADEQHREVPFTIQVDDHFEVGRIDLLIREGDDLTVVDWKSDKVEPGAEQQHAELRHRHQADAYVRALRTSLPQLHVREVVFVFARTGGQAVLAPEPGALF